MFVFVGFNFTSNMGELDTQTLAQYMHETVNHFLCINFLIIIFACLEKGKSFYMIPQSLQGKWAQATHAHLQESWMDVQCILNCADTVEAVEDAQRPFVKYNLKLSRNLLSF